MLRIGTCIAALIAFFALAGEARSQLLVDVEFTPQIASVGDGVAFFFGLENRGADAVDVTVELVLAVAGLDFTVITESTLDPGEQDCAEIPLVAFIPGSVSVSVNAWGGGFTGRDSATLLVLPGGSSNPQRPAEADVVRLAEGDLESLAENVLSSLAPCFASPVEVTSWGAVKSLYR